MNLRIEPPDLVKKSNSFFLVPCDQMKDMLAVAAVKGSTFIGGEAALFLDGDEGPLAIDDLAVEDVVADDEDGSVLRLVIVQVADELPAEGHVADAGFKITLRGKKICKTGMTNSNSLREFQAFKSRKTNLHFNDGPLVFLALGAFYEELHGFESRMI